LKSVCDLIVAVLSRHVRDIEDTMFRLCTQVRSFEDIQKVSQLKIVHKDIQIEVVRYPYMVKALCEMLVNILDAPDSKSPTTPSPATEAYNLAVILKEIPTVVCSPIIIASVIAKPFAKHINHLVECLELCFCGTPGLL
jgi:hypothetical protein